MSAESEVKTKVEDPMDTWPPVQHMIRKEDRPAKPGDRALCGAKLMGIDLGDFVRHRGNVCPKCLKIWKGL